MDAGGGVVQAEGFADPRGLHVFLRMCAGQSRHSASSVRLPDGRTVPMDQAAGAVMEHYSCE